MKNIDYKHIVQAEDIIPIRDHVLVCDMNFQAETTKGGIILTNDDGRGAGIRPRWGKVYAKGPENKDDYISKVLSFAYDQDKLEKIRKFIFDEILKTNTFNTKKFAANFWKSILDTYTNHN